MPSKQQWEKWVHKAWFYTKVIFAVLALMTATYWWGTYNPNKSAVSKVNADLDEFYMNKIEDMDLKEPEFAYNNDIQFIRAMHKCIDYINFKTPKHLRVPYEMIIGQAALESAWGASRFATEGNNLFGIRTFSESVPHLKPSGVEKWPGWGVRVFASKCDSVKEYIRLLNEHSAYKEFRVKRQLMLDKNRPLDSFVLIKTLDAFSTTKDYDKRVIRMINKIKKLETK